jgi:hypothetical protein
MLKKTHKRPGTPLDEPATTLGLWTKTLGAILVEIVLDPHPRLVALDASRAVVGSLVWTADGRYHVVTRTNSWTVTPAHRFPRSESWEAARKAKPFVWYHEPMEEKNVPQFARR